MARHRAEVVPDARLARYYRIGLHQWAPSRAPRHRAKPTRAECHAVVHGGNPTRAGLVAGLAEGVEWAREAVTVGHALEVRNEAIRREYESLGIDPALIALLEGPKR